MANLCTSTTLYRKGFSKQNLILQFTIYNNSYVTTKEVRIYTEMHSFFFSFFLSPRVRFFFFFFLLLIPKKGGKALLHYKGLQMYNYTVRSMWSLLGYIIDTDSTSKTRKTTKFYIYIYIYIYAKVYTKYTRYIYRSKTRKRISHAK